MLNVTGADQRDSSSVSAFLIEAYEGLARTVIEAIGRVSRRHVKGGVNDENLFDELRKRKINGPALIVEELINEGRIIKNGKGKYIENKNWNPNANLQAPVNNEWCADDELPDDQIIHALNLSSSTAKEPDMYNNEKEPDTSYSIIQESNNEINPYILLIDNLTEEVKFLRTSLQMKDEIIRDLAKSAITIKSVAPQDVGTQEQQKKQPHSQQMQQQISKQQKQKEKARKEEIYKNIPYDYKTPPTKSAQRLPETREWDQDLRRNQQNIEIKNKYIVLSSTSDHDETNESEKTIPPKKTTPITSNRPSKPYKEPAFWNNKVPQKGNFNSSNVERNGKKVTIFSDSMCTGMWGNDMSRKAKTCRVQVKAFNGATSQHLKSFHMMPTLQEHPPDTAIIHVGTNSLRTTRGEAPTSEEDIAHGIIDCAFTCKSFGVENIVISGICERRGKFFAKRLQKVNDILETYCEYYNFSFIRNDAIKYDTHLKDDGIHLNNDGREILIESFLKEIKYIYG